MIGRLLLADIWLYIAFGLVRTMAAIPALVECVPFVVEASAVITSELAIVMLAIADCTAAFAEEAWPAVELASLLCAIAVCAAALAEEAARDASERTSVMLARADCVPAFAEAAAHLSLDSSPGRRASRAVDLGASG